MAEAPPRESCCRSWPIYDLADDFEGFEGWRSPRFRDAARSTTRSLIQIISLVLQNIAGDKSICLSLLIRRRWQFAQGSSRFARSPQMMQYGVGNGSILSGDSQQTFLRPHFHMAWGRSRKYRSKRTVALTSSLQVLTNLWWCFTRDS